MVVDPGGTELAVGAVRQACYRCGKPKSSDEFVRKLDDRHFNMCRSCLSEVQLARAGELGKPRLVHTETERTCYLCRRYLPVTAFTQRRNGTYFSACKACNQNVFAQRRRARMYAAGGSHTAAEWRALTEQYERCPRCLRAWSLIPLLPGQSSPLTKDHIVPVAKGGTDAIDNLQPLCFSCNSIKGDRQPG